MKYTKRMRWTAKQEHGSSITIFALLFWGFRAVNEKIRGNLQMIASNNFRVTSIPFYIQMCALFFSTEKIQVYSSHAINDAAEAFFRLLIYAHLSFARKLLSSHWLQPLNNSPILPLQLEHLQTTHSHTRQIELTKISLLVPILKMGQVFLFIFCSAAVASL